MFFFAQQTSTEPKVLDVDTKKIAEQRIRKQTEMIENVYRKFFTANFPGRRQPALYKDRYQTLPAACKKK